MGFLLLFLPCALCLNPWVLPFGAVQSRVLLVRILYFCFQQSFRLKFYRFFWFPYSGSNYFTNSLRTDSRWPVFLFSLSTACDLCYLIYS